MLIIEDPDKKKKEHHIIDAQHRGKRRIDLYSSPFTLIYYPEHIILLLHHSETHKLWTLTNDNDHWKQT